MMKTRTTHKTSLEHQLQVAVGTAIATTVEKSKPLLRKEVLSKVGVGSHEHTMFRSILAPKIAEIVNKITPISQAWIYGTDATESNPGAGDASGDGSMCDRATGVGLQMLFKVGEKNSHQLEVAAAVTQDLDNALKSNGIQASKDYLRIDFIDPHDIDEQNMLGVKVTSFAMYPATQVWTSKDTAT